MKILQVFGHTLNADKVVSVGPVESRGNSIYGFTVLMEGNTLEINAPYRRGSYFRNDTQEVESKRAHEMRDEFVRLWMDA